MRGNRACTTSHAQHRRMGHPPIQQQTKSRFLGRLGVALDCMTKGGSRAYRVDLRLPKPRLGKEGAAMKIIGCDFHPSYQQIAMVDSETGELWEGRFEHEKGEARKF